MSQIRAYEPSDLADMTEIWNQVVREGVAFPQEELLTPETAASFFAAQSFCGVAVDDAGGRVCGLYILHPNNLGRCGHIANASYAVESSCRGMHIGEQLVRDSITRAHGLGFRLLQFNAVAADNAAARHLYERLGFRLVGMIPGGFRRSPGQYQDICIYYIPV